VWTQYKGNERVQRVSRRKITGPAARLVALTILGSIYIPCELGGVRDTGDIRLGLHEAARPCRKVNDWQSVTWAIEPDTYGRGGGMGKGRLTVKTGNGEAREGLKNHSLRGGVEQAIELADMSVDT